MHFLIVLARVGAYLYAVTYHYRNAHCRTTSTLKFALKLQEISLFKKLKWLSQFEVIVTIITSKLHY